MYCRNGQLLRCKGMRINGLIEHARNQVSEVSPSAVADAIDDYLVVDVREPGEVLAGYLPAALNVPRGIIEYRATQDPQFDDLRRPILVYSGTGIRSLLACLTLKQLGFENAQSLAGGIERWSAEDLPIE